VIQIANQNVIIVPKISNVLIVNQDLKQIQVT